MKTWAITRGPPHKARLFVDVAAGISIARKAQKRKLPDQDACFARFISTTLPGFFGSQ